MKNIKNMPLEPKKSKDGNQKRTIIRDRKLRSGSPGVRNKGEDIYDQSLKSNDPKSFIESQFKSEMKQSGIHKDIKNLKNFK